HRYPGPRNPHHLALPDPELRTAVPGPLIVAVAPPPGVAHDVAANARAHAAAIRRAGARVVVFPELSLTGYELDAAPVDPADPRLTPIIRACADTGATALLGAPITDNSNKSADNSK